MTTHNEEKVRNLLDRIKVLKEKSHELDLSSKEDLGIGVMNLISLEEHFYFTYQKTKDDNFLQLLGEVREMRKEMLAKIVKNTKGEVWCISKHLLAAAMRFIEVGTKKLGVGEEKEARELFDKAYTLWNIFWGLNLDLLGVKDIESEAENKEENLEVIVPRDDSPSGGKKITLWGKLGNIIEKIMDCCKE
ncbi:MAG: hypothetical protein NT136_02520 [Candidatus Moranbacteria bacterium]|nr:hypothetical protein [Candidatus Moranbacteria bacterium]